MLVTFIIISSSDLESIFRSCIGSGDDWMFQAYFSAGLTRIAKPKKTKYVQLLFLCTYFIFDNWNVYIWHSRSSPNYMALLLELLVALEWQFWSLPWEMWTMTRSKAVPMSKVPPKPNRRPYNTGIATSKGPFWYGGTRTCSTIRSRSRHVRSLTNTHTQTHTQHKQDRHTYHLKGLWEHFCQVLTWMKHPGDWRNGQVIITFWVS